MKEREKNPLLHHKVREFDMQKKVFEQLTVAATVLDDPQTAFQEIDRVLRAALRYKRPAYIELPRDIVTLPGHPRYQAREIPEASDAHTLQGALADVAVHRFGLQNNCCNLWKKPTSPLPQRCWANPSSASSICFIWAFTKARWAGRRFAATSNRPTV